MVSQAYRIIKPLLFQLDAEKAHEITLRLLKHVNSTPLLRSWVRKDLRPAQPPKRYECMGLSFINKIGLAAGFDKNAAFIREMSLLGFGFIEIGTVTPRPQIGNPKPRLFRLPKDEALINRMGFNNEGVEAAARRLHQLDNHNVIIGGNIGKNKDTPNDKAYQDYQYCLMQLGDLVDYFVVNVSSPNTPGLRSLQNKEPLKKILSELQVTNQGFSKPRPILLKIAPDLETSQLMDIVDLVQECNLTGVVATNTTIDRSELATSTEKVKQIGAGGLSGRPLQAKSVNFVKLLRQNLPPEKVLIGVGGINGSDQASALLSAGANLLQVYSGMIYRGPQLVKELIEAI